MTPSTQGAKVDRRHELSGRRRLSRELIIAAALDLVVDTGLDNLTMRALAVRLQADPSAVYRHFRNKDELLGALADSLLLQVAQPPAGPPDEPDGVTAPDAGSTSAWYAQLVVTARRLRAMLRAQPQLAPLVTGAPVTPATLRATADILEQVQHGARVDLPTATRALHAAIAYVVGFALLEAGAPPLDRPPVDGGRTPADDAALRLWQPGRDEVEDRFTTGLAAVLDGLTRR